MSRRMQKIGITLGLFATMQAGMAAPLLTTPEQSVSFCVGVCGTRLDNLGTVFSGAGILQSFEPSLAESTTGNFLTFNPSLGILRSVTFTLTSAIRGGLEAEGALSDPSPADTFQFDIDPKLSLLGLGELLSAALLPTSTLNVTPDAFGFFPDAGASSTVARNAGLTLTAPADNLSFYTTGASFDAEFAHLLTLTNDRGDNATLTGNATWSGNLKLQYAYEERPTTSIPEPGTLALVGLGLLFGVRGMRRQEPARSA